MTDNSVSEFARNAQYKATIKLLSNRSRSENIITLIENTRTLTSGLMNVVEQKSEALACKVGCNFCCYLMATVSAPETLSIVHQLKETYSPEKIKDIKQKVEQAYQKTEKMSNLARVKNKVACPFLLEEGTCSIYTYRPLDCLTHHSLNRQPCEEIFEQPEQVQIPANADLQSIGIGIKTGLGQGIATANLEHPSLRYELIEAMQICLNDEQAMEKYLDGNNIFEPAAIMIDSEKGISYKIKYAPHHLKTHAKKVISLERREAQREKRKKQKK